MLLPRRWCNLVSKGLFVVCVAGCSVLQCVAVCCSVLQCVAVYCSVFKCVTVCYSGAVSCSEVQCCPVS